LARDLAFLGSQGIKSHPTEANLLSHFVNPPTIIVACLQGQSQMQKLRLRSVMQQLFRSIPENSICNPRGYKRSLPYRSARTGTRPVSANLWNENGVRPDHNAEPAAAGVGKGEYRGDILACGEGYTAELDRDMESHTSESHHRHCDPIVEGPPQMQVLAVRRCL
jgi:hypothetical protein